MIEGEKGGGEGRGREGRISEGEDVMEGPPLLYLRHQCPQQSKVSVFANRKGDRTAI